MKNKKGFTLIELLAVIIMLGIVALIAIPAVSKYLNSSTDTTYKTYEKSMTEAAKNWIIECISGNLQCDLPSNNNDERVSLSALIEEGFIDNMKDPDGNNFCSTSSYVIIKGDKVEKYQYNACLSCGEYHTNNSDCS